MTGNVQPPHTSDRCVSAKHGCHVRGARLVLGMLLGLGAGACAEHKTDMLDAGLSNKPKCPSPGSTGTCTCGAGRSGMNTCGVDNEWSACICMTLPDASLCRDGDAVRCTNLCRGETTPRVTRCSGGNYDCTCSDAGTHLDAGS
jgi:hypothetical protein